MSRRTQFVLGIAAGACTGILVPILASMPFKRVVLVLLAVAAMVVVIVSRDRERLLLVGLVFLLPLNINYFLFGLYAPHIGGAPGLYLLPLDLPLALLCFLWFLDWVLDRENGPPRSNYYLLLFLPFLALGAASIFYSTRSSWAAYEWVRWVRAAAILIYAAKKVRLADLRFCLTVLAVSVVFQGAIALAQTGFRSNLGLDKLGVAGKGSENAFVQEVGTEGDVVRGAGTMGHPNILASYLVLTVPLFLMLSLAETHRRWKMAWLSAITIGVAALACTLTRADWLALLCVIPLVMALAVGMRLIDLKRALTLSLAGLSLVALAAAPFTSVILERFRSNYSDSLQFRVGLNRGALNMTLDHPILGVGLNNFTLLSAKYAPPGAQTALEDLPVAVHNLYLLVWSELGTVGLFAFAAFWTGAFWHAYRATTSAQFFARAVIGGTLCGLAGLLIGDFFSFALWTDSNLLTCILLVGLFEPLSASQRPLSPVVG